MTVPIILHNSVGSTRFIIDAPELNANFSSITDGSAIDDEAISPRHIGPGKFTFSDGIVLGLTASWPTMEEGRIFYFRETGRDGGFYGIIKDSTDKLIYVAL